MPDVAYPSLTSEGYVHQPDRKLDRLLACAFASDYSQSNRFRGKVTSVQYQIAEHKEDASALAAAIRSSLEQYLGRYYEAVALRVVVEPLEADFTKLNIQLSGSVQVGQSRLDLAKTIPYRNGVLTNLMG